MHAVEMATHRLTIGVEENNRQTKEMYEAFAAARGGFKALEWIAKLAKPLVWILALVISVAYYIKTGDWRFGI